MLTPILDHWWPVTYDFGLIKSDIDNVAAARSSMYANADLETTTTWLREPLENCFSLLEPLAPAPTKELFLATTFGWTAYYSNGCRGSDPALSMVQLSKALDVMCLRACFSPVTAIYPSVILEVFDTPEAGGDKYGNRRSIAASNDGGRWAFEQSGIPYAFEDISKFDARRKRDRFTRETLASYLENLGIPRLTDDTLQQNRIGRGFLLARSNCDHLPRYSLEEAKSL